MDKHKHKVHRRLRRHAGIRARVVGTPSRPRLAVYRSLKHIYAQVIDDNAGRTVVAASTLDKDLKGALKKGSDLEAAQAVGKLVAERALKAGVTNVVFDRGGYIYHGRVKALADAAREAGLNF